MNSDELDFPKTAFDPKLREAMQKILAIAREYDCGAFIALTSKQHGETRTRYPTWSVGQVENEGGRNLVRIKTKGKPREWIPFTINMLDAWFLECGQFALYCESILKKLHEHWDFKTESQQGPEAPPWDFR